MTIVYFPLSRPPAQETMLDEAQHRRNLAHAVNLTMAGQDNSTMMLTLDGATTVVSDPRISLQTVCTLMPTTAAAAAALPSMWVACSKGEATIHGGSVGLTYTLGIQG